MRVHDGVCVFWSSGGDTAETPRRWGGFYGERNFPPARRFILLMSPRRRPSVPPCVAAARPPDAATGRASRGSNSATERGRRWSGWRGGGSAVRVGESCVLLGCWPDTIEWSTVKEEPPALRESWRSRDGSVLSFPYFAHATGNRFGCQRILHPTVGPPRSGRAPHVGGAFGERGGL